MEVSAGGSGALTQFDLDFVDIGKPRAPVDV